MCLLSQSSTLKVNFNIKKCHICVCCVLRVCVFSFLIGLRKIINQKEVKSAKKMYVCMYHDVLCVCVCVYVCVCVTIKMCVWNYDQFRLPYS